MRFIIGEGRKRERKREAEAGSRLIDPEKHGRPLAVKGPQCDRSAGDKSEGAQS